VCRWTVPSRQSITDTEICRLHRQAVRTRGHQVPPLHQQGSRGPGVDWERSGCADGKLGTLFTIGVDDNHLEALY